MVQVRRSPHQGPLGPPAPDVEPDVVVVSNTIDVLQGRILIVDDKSANILLLEQVLRRAGYLSLRSTSDSREVGALHREHSYDLILLDLHMPDMDGFAVMEELKTIETSGYLPVLVITAQPEKKLRALEAGAKDFISKPFDLPEVLLRVHNMLEVRLLHQQARALNVQLLAEKEQSRRLAEMPGTMVGLEREERLATHWWRSLRMRYPWLFINLLTAFVAAGVVGAFQSTINRLLILTIFLPILVSQSANTGSQALAITLRGMTLGDLRLGTQSPLIRKEALLGLLNGALVGLVAALGMLCVATLQHLPHALMLSAVVWFAMIGSCILSGICGAVVPLLLRRLGADPVTASSIVLTAATDVASMGILLWLATVLIAE